MKKTKLLILPVLLVLVFFLAGCSDATEAKELIVVNNSETAIYYVEIEQYIDDDTSTSKSTATTAISAGESKTYLIAPSATDSDIYIYYLDSTDATTGYVYTYFEYDYLVDNKNEPITFTFNYNETDGPSLTFSGSNVTELTFS